MLNSSIPSAAGLRHRPPGPMGWRRTSLHFQRCLVLDALEMAIRTRDGAVAEPRLSTAAPGAGAGAAAATHTAAVAGVVEFNPEVGLMSVRIEGRVYLLDKEDLAMVGAVLVRLVAEGTPVTPTMISTILRHDL